MRFTYYVMVLSIVLSSFAEAKKRYRQRNHKVELGMALTFDNLMKLDQKTNQNFVHIGYARNFKVFEIGGFLTYQPDIDNLMRIEGFEELTNGLKVGVSGEFNIIPNKRRNKWIPAVGIKAIYQLHNESQIADGDWAGVFVNPYFVSKHFISTRTSINIELELVLKAYPFESNFWKIWDTNAGGIRPSIKYAYYFH